VGKFKKIDSRLLIKVTAAVEACWTEGSPVAGSSPDQWQETAQRAIRRIRSFSRRNLSELDRDSQIRDIANGFVAAFESEPKLVGPLIIDYQYVAEKTLEAVRRYEGEGA
jgi:hypothetical protein